MNDFLTSFLERASQFLRGIINQRKWQAANEKRQDSPRNVVVLGPGPAEQLTPQLQESVRTNYLSCVNLRNGSKFASTICKTVLLLHRNFAMKYIH